MFELTQHAKRQIRERQVTSDEEVLTVLTRKENLFNTVNPRITEVRITIKKFSSVVVCDDGSNGDIVVACVDRASKRVKTVMLTNTYQVKQKMKEQLKVKYI